MKAKFDFDFDHDSQASQATKESTQKLQYLHGFVSTARQVLTVDIESKEPIQNRYYCRTQHLTPPTIKLRIHEN